MIRFCYNPTSWNREAGVPWPGGMADCLIQPVLPHLPEGSWEIADRLTDRPDRVNVIYAHLSRYGLKTPPPGRTVFVSHGIADKRWRNADRVWQYDYVFVSGPAWTERMAAGGLAAPRVREVGYAKLDPIFNGQIEQPDRLDTRIRVVWAPTHGGGGERLIDAPQTPSSGRNRRTSHWHRDEILSLLPPSEFDVVEALHPRHRPDKKATLAEYVGADVVIADGGSTIYEAMALDLPVVLTTWLTGAANMRPGTLENTVYVDRIGRHALMAADLPRLVVEAAADGITDREREFIEPIIPRATRGIAGKLHADALLEIADDPALHRTRGRPKVVYRNRTGRTARVLLGSVREQHLARSGRWERVG